MTQVPRRDSYRYQSQLAAGSGLTYLNPLVMTRLACIFRRSDAVHRHADFFQKPIDGEFTRDHADGPGVPVGDEAVPKKGPYFISLNRA